MSSSSDTWKRSAILRHEGRFFDVADWDTVHCRLCPHLCAIAPARTGSCGVRSNRDGKLVLDSYGRIASESLVEGAELPLYHFHPADRWLLLGMRGCSWRCSFCNTAKYSQLAGAQTAYRAPEEIVAAAGTQGAHGIAFGVNEPLVAHEFVVDVFRAARGEGLRTFAASAGTWCEDPFKEITDTADAVTFGFKGFDTEFTTKECGGHLDAVRANVEAALARHVHAEIAYLVIDGHEAWRAQAENFAEWLAALDATVPVIVMGIEKAFSWKGEPARRDSLVEARGILGARLRHVYLHDPALACMDTACTGCGKILVRRGLAGTIMTSGAGAACPHCGAAAPYVC